VLIANGDYLFRGRRLFFVNNSLYQVSLSRTRVQ